MLRNKVAVITGSSSGIGKEIALNFVKNGAKVVINYPFEGSKSEAEKVVAQIQEAGGEAIAVMADVSQFEQAQALMKVAVDTFGSLDILVNNAGITRDMLLLRMTEEEFDRVININLKGVFNCMKHGSRIMMKKGGSIINMSSVVGLHGNIGQCNYAASKAGVIGMTKSAAREFASKNLRINAIAPGFIVSNMTDKLPEAIKENTLKGIPINRFGNVEEVANVALFLASDLSSYVTGEVIKVDGGMAM
ncbi:MAG: 3-oxoacyl-[acyl-carrier-protein] reductase [Niameybacter sp.]|uniref:3-oxoacyl-[acyl-carrier-protein] reductase n=1 Tax=Niameybacter sp. TaxID=2033640 RepID=UPI002FC870B4